MLIEFFREASIVAKLGILIAFAPVAGALLYVVGPSERRLALVRPLSLAGLFAGLSSFSSGVIGLLTGLSFTAEIGWLRVAAGAAECVAALFISFACLTITWLLVALGMRRANG
jgi:hypothetical protein